MSRIKPVFADRHEAGRLLAQRLREVLDEGQFAAAVTIGLPRGGVPVASEVAQELGTPLDVLFVRKLGAPMQPEYAIGALCEDGTAYVNDEAARRTGTTDEMLREIIDTELSTIDRYRKGLASVRRAVDIKGRHVILVDDGLATGMTAMAAARDLRRRGARSVTLAVPVGAAESLEDMEDEFDRAVSVERPRYLSAIGFWYRSFLPVSEDEVAEILAASNRPVRSRRR